MENPAKAASRLLLSTGLGLLLVTGLALQRNLFDFSTLNIGYIIPFGAIILIALSKNMNSGKGPLAELFPDEDEEDLIERVSEEARAQEKEEKVGGAWASLEASLLSTEFGEEE